MTTRPGPTEAPDALARLERRLDGRLTRLATKLALNLPRRHSRTRSGGDGTELSVKDTSTSPGHEQLVEQLSSSLRNGALESAPVLAARLAPQLSALPAASVARAASLVVDALIVSGDRQQAEALARAHAAKLETRPDGVTLLELLGLRARSTWLPNGRPNLMALSRAIEEGSLDATQLAEELARRPWLWVRVPELHLLLFNALLGRDDARACDFLNRFLSTHGLPLCRLPPGPKRSNNLLAELAFEAEPAAPPGPLVSVLVAARNAAETLSYSLDSLCAQSYRELEILVGDDASQDASWALLTRNYAANARVRLFRSRRQQGAYNLKNALAARARGELLAFHDADDLALPNRIARQVAALKQRGVVACVSNLLRMRPSGSVVFFKDQRASRLSMVSLLVQRGAFESVGPFRSARVGADLELYERLRGRFGDAAVSRARVPLMFSLWAKSSTTRAPGTEALEDGYRAPARRLYSQIVFDQRNGRQPLFSSEEVDELLRKSDNFLDSCEIDEADRA